MPLITEDQATGALTGLPGVLPQIAEPPKPSFGETLSAVIESGSKKAFADAMSGGTDALMPGYNPWSFGMGVRTQSGALPTQPGYNPYQDPQTDDLHGDDILHVSDSQSPEETRQIIAKLRAEHQTRDVLARSGGMGVALSIADGIVDPATIIAMALPVAAPEAWGSRAARIGYGVAASVAADSATEALLQSQQELRDWKDSAIAIGAGALVTGAMGAWATRMPKSEFDLMRDAVSAELKAADSTTGAMHQWGNVKLEDLNIDSTVGRWIAKSFGKISPLTRVMQSSSKEARMLALETADVPYLLKGNVEGTVTNPVALETRIQQQTMQSFVTLVRGFDDAYATYVKRVGKDAVSRTEFGHMVSAAARRGDKSDIVEVSAAARNTREVFEADRKALVDFGLLEEDAKVLGAESYFPRVYDYEAIRQNAIDFRARIEKWISENPKVVEETKDVLAARKRLDALAAKAPEGGAAPGSHDAVVAAHQAEVETARKAHTQALKDLQANREAQVLAGRELRQRERASEAISQQLYELETRRAGLAEDMKGSTPEQITKAEARLDREIERVRQQGIKQDDLRAKAQKAAIEAEQARDDIKAAIKDARKAVSEAIQKAKAVKEDARMVAAHDAEVEKAKNAYRDPAEIKAQVEEIVSHIMGTFRGRADLGRAVNPKVLKSRVFDIPDTVIEPYLVSDYQRVMQGYLRSIKPQIEARKMGLGPEDWDARLAEVGNEYKNRLANAKSPAEISKINKEAESVLNNLGRMRDRMMNQYGAKGGAEFQTLVRVARLTRSYNYMRLLGSQTVSSLSDFAHVASRYGLARTSARLGRFIVDSGFRKMSRAAAQRFGTALDRIIDTRGSTLAEIGDSITSGYGVMGKIERGMEHATGAFTKYTLMSSWNEMIKTLTVSLESDALLRAARNPAGLSKFKRGQLAAIGFGDDELRRLAEMPIDDSDGLLRAGTEAWPDKELAAKFETAMVRAANVMSLTKGAGDLPLAMDHEAIKTLFQFKSFGMSSVNRIMIPVAQGLSHGDAATASGAAMMIALGGATYAAKEYAAGREPDLSAGSLAVQAVNWSGLTGFFPDIWDPIAGLGPKPMRGMRFSKFSDQEPIQTALGPTMGTTVDLYNVIRGITDGSVKASDIHAARKMLPYQNFVALRRVFNAIEGEFAEGVGAEGATNKTFTERVTQTDAPH